MTTDKIESIIQDFTARIRAEVQRQAVAALTSNLGPDGIESAMRRTLAKNERDGRKATNGAKPAPVNRKTTEPNGSKRDPKVIETLQNKLLVFVTAHPGLRIEQINKGMGSTTRALALPVKKLLASKVLKAHGEKRATTYFVRAKR